MKLKYYSIFVFLIVLFLSMNMLVASDVDDTNLTATDNSPMAVDEIYGIYDSDNLMDENLNEISESELDSIEEDKLTSDGYTHVYISPEGNGEGTSDNPTSFVSALTNVNSNTIVHLTEGNYDISITSTIKISNKENITLLADNPINTKIIKFSSTKSPAITLNNVSHFVLKDIVINEINNQLIKTGNIKNTYHSIELINCNFSNMTVKNKQLFYIANEGSSISVLNCNFSHLSTSIFSGKSSKIIIKNSNFRDFHEQYATPLVLGGYADISNCNFTNVMSINVGGLFNSSITGCYFNVYNNNSAIYGTFIDDKVHASNIIFKNNTVENKFIFRLTKEPTYSKIISPTFLTVLNNEQVSATSGDVINITAVLVDDMGNYISIPKINFSIDGENYSATYNKGVYSVEYTVPDVDQSKEIFFDSNLNVTYLKNLKVVYPNPFLLIKPALNMSMDNISDSSYREDITVTVNISNLESGSLVYEFIKGNDVIKTVTDSFTNNVSTVTVNDLPAGDYTVKVKYLEDDNFGTTTVSKQFTVNKANSTVRIIIDPTIPVGDNITVQAVLPANATGNVTYRLKGENKTVNVTESAVFAGLSEGNYTIYAVYNGDDNYNLSEEYNATFKVVKVDPKLVIEYSAPVINENVTVTVTMDEDINGEVNVTINKLDPVVRQVVNGTLTFNITNVPYGPQNITVSFRGNDKYNEIENNISFFVNKLDVNLVITADTVTYGEPLVVKVTANEKFTGDVIVKIGNLTETAHVVDGVGNATFNNLTAGEYFINATFTEDETFNADAKNITAAVKGVEVSADKAVNTNVPANSKSPTFSINLDKDATGTFTVTVDGKVVGTKQLVDGSASITVANLAAGNHKVDISYSGDDKYAPISKSTTLNIKEPAKPIVKKATKITAKKKTFKAKVKVKKYTIVLKAGKKPVSKVWVTLKIKGKKVIKAKTNAKGKATFKIKKLTKKGKYSATVKFAGNKNFKASSKKVKITVKK